jgi:hypothetical protein
MAPAGSSDTQQQQQQNQNKERKIVMNYITRNVLETGIRVLAIKTEPGVPTTNARANTLFASVATEVTAMETHAMAQAAGAGVVHSGAVQRREIAKALRQKLREVADTAKGLDDETYPGVAAQFRMPRSRTYQALLAAGRAFVSDVGAVKAGFVEEGLPADFDEQLADVVASFAAATGVRDAGLAEQIGGTAAVDAKASVVRKIIRKLRPLMNNLLKNDPALLAAWKAASHIRRRPVSESAASGGGGSPPSLAAVVTGPSAEVGSVS